MAENPVSKHPLLEIDALRVGFRTLGVLREVVKGVSFRVPAGKTVALVGESGSGKSVISQSIMGLLPRNGDILGGDITFRDPDQPEIAIEIAALGRDGEEMRRLRGGRIGMIFQEPMSSLSPLHTIGDQIGEAFDLHIEADGRGTREIVTNMLARVGFKNPKAAFDQYPFELSGGLRQRAMLAMALICKPALLIADEPTTALDVTIQAQVLGLMQELQEELGMAILLITHDLGVVANMADEIVVVYHGEVMEAGTTEDIFRNPQHPYLKSLFKALPRLDMRPGERLLPMREVKRVIPATSLPAQPAKAGAGKPLIEVKNLTKSFGDRPKGLFGFGEHAGFKAVDNVSLTIAPGECLGLVGESGSGKTTLSKMIMRALIASSGSIIYRKGGEEIDVLGLEGEALRSFRMRMQMVFQDPANSLSPRMTIRDILREPLNIHGIGSNAERDARITELMRMVGLDTRFLNRYPHSLSGGQKQRVGIARALALSPDLIVCDEPVSALDVSIQAQVLNLLKDLAAERGLAYLFITHNLAVVKYMADRIAVMANGRIVESAPANALFERPVHAYTKALHAAVPYAELDHGMNFAAFAATSASDMSTWPSVFQHHGKPEDLVSLDLGGGHFVLAHRDADHKELVA